MMEKKESLIWPIAVLLLLLLVTPVMATITNVQVHDKDGDGVYFINETVILTFQSSENKVYFTFYTGNGTPYINGSASFTGVSGTNYTFEKEIELWNGSSSIQLSSADFISDVWKLNLSETSIPAADPPNSTLEAYLPVANVKEVRLTTVNNATGLQNEQAILKGDKIYINVTTEYPGSAKPSGATLYAVAVNASNSSDVMSKVELSENTSSSGNYTGVIDASEVGKWKILVNNSVDNCIKSSVIFNITELKVEVATGFVIGQTQQFFVKFNTTDKSGSDLAVNRTYHFVVTLGDSRPNDKFSYAYSDGNITLTNSNILITSTSSSAGFIWVGSNTDVSVDGVGITYQGITGVVSSKATFKLMTDGTLYVGPDYFNQTTTDASIAFDGTDLDIQNVNLNITTTGVGYVWLGNTSLNQGVGLATGISGYDTGFYAANGGDITVAISAEDGSFTFGEISGPNISYDGSILALIDTSIDVTGGYVWAGSGTPGTGTGVGLISTGFYGFNGTTQTAFISATDGTFQFGPDGKCVKYDGSTLAVTGSNLTLSSGNYVWVGTPFVGVGFNEDGLLATDSGGTTTAYILANDGSFSFGKSGGNQLSYNPSTGDITLNGATISDWGDVSGSNLPAQNATVGATAGTNMYSSGGSTIPEAEVLNYTQGRDAYDGVSFPDITGKPMAINAYITTGGTGGWYKVASVTFGGQYGAFSFHGLFSKGESDGRVTTQSRVKLGCTSDASNNVSSPFYRYSGDNPTTYLKLRYSGTTVTLYCWLAQYDSVVLQGNWTCYPKSGGSSWFDNYQTDLDTIGSSDPGGTNVTATANYELEATVGATAGTNLYRGSGSTLYDVDVITSQGTADDVEYGSGKAVYQAHADRTSLNTADDTDHVNGAETDSGYTYDVLGDLRIMNGKDIEFYTGDGSGFVGGIYASGTNLRTQGTNLLLYSSNGTITLQTNSSSNPIWALAHFHPFSTNGGYDLGNNTYRWGGIFSEDLNISGNPTIGSSGTTFRMYYRVWGSSDAYASIEAYITPS